MKASASSASKFKKKGNKKQFEVNNQVLEHIETASSLLESTPSQVEKALSELIADSVKNCWEMVSEYECKDVADESDDEKVLGGQKLEVLRNVAAHNLKRIVRVSFAIGRRQISPSMPYYSSSTSSTVPFASLTSSPTAWNSQFPNNWSRTSL